MDKDKRKKLVKDSMKSRIASINRSVASPKYIAKEFKEQHGLSTKQFDLELKDLGLTASQQSKIKNKLSKQFDKAVKNLEKLRKKEHSKFYKGKPHLKKGGKAKKMKAYSKGGKAK